MARMSEPMPRDENRCISATWLSQGNSCEVISWEVISCERISCDEISCDEILATRFLAMKLIKIRNSHRVCAVSMLVETRTSRLQVRI